MVNGVNHITFAVSNVKRSIAFYHGLLGLKLVATWQTGAYLLAGDLWIALNLDENCRTQPQLDYTHVAFNVLEEHYCILKTKLEKEKVPKFQENASEGDSFYFLDPDGHKLELHYDTIQSRITWAKENLPGFTLK